MATFVMQILGCEVASLNTVQFSENSLCIRVVDANSKSTSTKATILATSSFEALELQQMIFEISTRG